MFSGVHSSSRSHFHKQTIFSIFSYSPHYAKSVWHFSQENSSHMKEQLTCLNENQHTLTSMLKSDFPFLLI